MQGVEADLYITGEFGHHHILDALSCSRSVIVCNHSNTERGYLKVLKSNLEKQLAEGYEFIISKVDKDPLVVFSYVYLVTNIITLHLRQNNKQQLDQPRRRLPLLPSPLAAALPFVAVFVVVLALAFLFTLLALSSKTTSTPDK